MIRYETPDQLALDVAYWQGVLRLRDWKIRARLQRDWDLGSLGKNTIDFDDRTCTIDISDTADHGLDVHDQEETLVHEMGHLHTRPIVRHFDKNHEEDQVEPEEQACNMFGAALVALRRK